MNNAEEERSTDSHILKITMTVSLIRSQLEKFYNKNSLKQVLFFVHRIADQ